MRQSHLVEVPEARVVEPEASIYEDIRCVLGLPFVNLLYRHLAAEPGRLGVVWAELRPILADSGAHRVAEMLAASAASNAAQIAVVPREALLIAEIDAETVAPYRATLEGYERANSRNLLAIHAVLAGSDGSGAREVDARRPVAEAPSGFTPMAELGELPQVVRVLLETMASPSTGSDGPVIIPSVYRHFAGNGCLLALMWTVLRPHLHSEHYVVASRAVQRSASESASMLALRVQPLADPVIRATLERFARVMGNMLVVGAMLTAALAEA